MSVFSRMIFSALRNEWHVEYNRENISILGRENPEALGFGAQYLQYKQAFEAEIALLDQIRKSEYTEQLHAQDQVRCSLFRGLDNAVKSGLDHYEDKVKKSAVALSIVMANYKKTCSLPFDQRTAALDDICRELDEYHGKDMSECGLGKWTLKIKEANAKYQQLVEARDEEAAEKPETKFKEARAETDRCLRVIFKWVEALDYTSDSPKFKSVFKKINACTERYKKLMTAARGHRSGNTDKAEA